VRTGAGSAGSSAAYAIHGPFAVGTRLSATPDGMQEALTATITELDDGRAYADQTEFNGLTLTDRHTLTPLTGGGTRITHQSVISGPGATTAGPQLGPSISEDYPAAMSTLIAAAAR
jgi:hypothetical protein